MEDRLGRPSGARFRTYERLKAHAEAVKGTLFAYPELLKAIEDIYRYPLLQTATDTLNRQLKSGISDQALAELVVSLRADARLCRVAEDVESTEPQVICSMGLRELTLAHSVEEATDRSEAAVFTLLFNKPTDERFSESDKKICSEEGFAALSLVLRDLMEGEKFEIEIVNEGSGEGSYWQEYAVYVTGFVALSGGLGNALQILGQALELASDITERLAQRMSRTGQWLQGVAWRLTPKAISSSQPSKRAGCFGDRKWLDRRTKRCRQCDFLSECATAAGNARSLSA